MTTSINMEGVRMNKEDTNIYTVDAAMNLSELSPKIEYAGIIRTSCDDGPGIRSVLFLQGCSRGCPDCHNASISRKGEGTLISVEELVEMITEQCKNRKLTISGGEPLEQLPTLLLLLTELKKRNFNLCLYTGWNLEQVPHAVLVLLNYIKVGDFQKELSHKPLRFVGSSNQQMYQLEDGKIVKEYQLREDI